MKDHAQFHSRVVPTKLSVAPRQHLTYSSSKIPKVVSSNIPDPSSEVSTVMYYSILRISHEGQGDIFLRQ